MKYVFANWKMYLDFDETMILTNQLLAEGLPSDITIGLFPNTIALTEVEKAINGTNLMLGAQNVAWVPKGAYTGATSALFYKNAGCTHALVGHSERRHIFNETNDAVRKKMEACLDVGLTPVLCIGETQQDVENNKQQYRLKKQLMKALEGLDIGNNDILIAYEPVWAIGSGKPCLPDDVEDMHEWIKQEVKNYTDKNIPVLYGGSVNAQNINKYISKQSVDGVLIGHASATKEGFTSIIQALSTS